MPTFLLVDDSPTVLLALAQAIRHARPGATLVEATEMSRAMKLFDDTRPDVVFVDMVLASDELTAKEGEEEPETAGLRLVQQMLARRPETRIVLVTSMQPTHPDITDAIALGVLGVLRKPVRAEDVKATLATLFPDADAMSYFG